MHVTEIDLITLHSSGVESTLCKTAASFNLIGVEIPLSLLVYIAIFRAYAICSMLKTISNHVTWVVCLIIWVLFVGYAGGLSFVTSIYDIQGDSNICIYVYFRTLVQDAMFQALSSVFVVLNLILLVMLFLAYAFLVWNVFSLAKSSAVSRKVARKRRHALSVRLSTILLFTVLCWLPLLLSQLLSLSGVNVPETVNVWMAILVLPINASFSPVMFGIIPIISSAKQK